MRWMDLNDAQLLALLVAITAALLAWAAAQFIVNRIRDSKKRIQERLGANRLRSTATTSVRMDSAPTGLSARLMRHPLMERLHQRISQGNPDATLTSFLAWVVGCSIGCWAIATLIFSSTALAVVAGVIGGYLPFLHASSARSRRQRLFTTQLPGALDFLARILRAGHSLSTGLQMMGEELQQPIASEFRRCYEQHCLGQPLEDSLRDMARRVGSTDFGFFVTAVLVQRQTGGDLAEVLTNMAGMVRQRLQFQQHVRAKTAEGRFTGYILVAFPTIMFLLMCALNATYAGVLLHTRTGLIMLGAAVGLQMIGLVAIRKITTVRV